MMLDQDQAKHARDIGLQQSRRHHKTQKHSQVENIFNNIWHPVGRPTHSLSVFTHHYSRDFLLNNLVYILVHTTHQTFIQRHLFIEPQLYQVKQVPREFDTRFLPFYTTCTIRCICRPSNTWSTLPRMTRLLNCNDTYNTLLTSTRSLHHHDAYGTWLASTRAT